MAMNELGFYALAGAPKTPKDLIEEVELAEHIGIGNCFLSERFNVNLFVVVLLGFLFKANFVKFLVLLFRNQ